MSDSQNEAPAVPPKPELCKVSEMFQYLRGSDRMLLIVGTIAGMIGGFAMPAFVFFFGKLTDSFNPEKGGDDTLSKSICSWKCI